MPAEFLWHYTTLAGAASILEQCALRASDIRFLNDSTEYELARQIFVEVLRNKASTGTRELEREFAARAEDALEGNRPYTFADLRESGYFAACFTEAADDLGQWRGYAGSGGCALGFDRNLIEEVAVGAGFTLRRCEYERAKARECLAAAYEGQFTSMQPELEDHWHITVNRAVAALFDEFDRIAPAVKDAAFGAEREVRFVHGPRSYKVPDRQGRVRFRFGRNVLVPYVDLPLASTAVPRTLRSIMVGPSPKRELVARSLRIAALCSGITLDSFEVQVSASPYRDW